MNKQFRWSIDPSHSEISFRVKHMMIAHIMGRFTVFDACIHSTEKNITTASIHLWIDPSSISTGDEKRDEHLKSVDFFDVLTHKQISFVSGSIGKADLNGKAEMWGELTMKGITKSICLDLQLGGMIIDPGGNEKAGFTVSGKINRNDFGLVWNTGLQNGGLLVGEDILILCEMEMIYNSLDLSIMQLDPSETRKTIRKPI